MSQDLFAAFNTPAEAPVSKAISPSISAAHPTITSQPDLREQNLVQDGFVEDEDDFGDFEDASTQPIPSRPLSSQPTAKTDVIFKNQPRTKVATKPLPFSPKPVDEPEIGKHPFANHMDLLFAMGDDEYDAGSDELNDLANNPEAAMAYSKRVIAEQMAREAANIRVDTKTHQNDHVKAPDVRKSKAPKDPNVLFDAEDLSENGDDEENDWGDFEESEPAPSKSNLTTAIDLLGLDDVSTTTEAVPLNLPRSSHVVPSQRTNVAVSSPKTSQPIEEEDAWDDFEASTPQSAMHSSPATQPSSEPSSINNPSSVSRSANDSTPTLAPTNIPPPSILLSIFPSLITSAQSDLFDPLSKLDPNQKKLLISHPATAQFLLKYIHLGHVLGYVVAGRKSRWKRDQILSQGMRIGPAVAGGGRGGMKLAGVDKGESAKEDREVLDVVRLWRLHVGKLRSAVALYNARSGDVKRDGLKEVRLPGIPEIAMQYPVRVVKQGEGGISAPQACALCGLKRDERVQQQGFEVEDMFDEWWLSKLNMHLLCWEFWQENKKRLRSR